MNVPPWQFAKIPTSASVCRPALSLASGEQEGLPIPLHLKIRPASRVFRAARLRRRDG